MAHNRKKPVEMSKTTDGWYDGKTGLIIPFRDLTDRHLQNALLNAERQEYYLFKRTAIFSQLVDKLTEEGERRGIELRHHKSNFTYNTHLKKSENKSD
jgi:hypothetical protein